VYPAFDALREALNAPSNDAPPSTDAGQAPKMDAEPVIAKGKRQIMVDETFDDLMYWLERCDEKGHLENCSDLIGPWSNFCYTNVPQPEPVAFYDFQTHKMRWAKPTLYREILAVDVPELPLYAAPPRREWVSLSLDQISMAWDRAYRQPLSQSALNFARYLENTLKERNHE
jgi:hypothetical protein